MRSYAELDKIILRFFDAVIGVSNEVVKELTSVMKEFLELDIRRGGCYVIK